MSPNPAPAADGMTEYYRRLERAHLAPLWESLAALAPREPKPRAKPFKWGYDEVRAHLLEAGRLISAEKAERRVVILANPGLGESLQATDTLYAGLQLILPGEIAPAHRHTQAALRFVMEGEGAWTSVEGEKVVMRPGDFIITPAWTWHAHGGGSEPVIWMDGLDVPLTGFLHAEFREDSAGPPPSGSGRAFAFPYADRRAELEELREARALEAHHGYRLDYLDPDTGGPVMPTIGAGLRLLPEGFVSAPYRSTDGVVASVVEGRVRAKVGETELELGPRDTLVVPAWTWWTLQAAQESVLFHFSDRPVHEALGLWREEKG